MANNYGSGKNYAAGYKYNEATEIFTLESSSAPSYSAPESASTPTYTSESASTPTYTPE